jgi:hypothetical protein
MPFGEAIRAVRPLAEAHSTAFGDRVGQLVGDLARALHAAGRGASIDKVLAELGIGVAEEEPHGGG